MHPIATVIPVKAHTLAYRQRLDSRRDELSQHLHRILPGPQPLVWEVGCGHGHFLTAYAEAHSTPLCVGIDLANDRVTRAQRKRDRSRSAHLHFLQADARLFLEVLPAGIIFTEVFILFPDPWPKLRHRKHRLIQDDFLNAVALRSTAGTRLRFRTDHAPYFEEARGRIERHPQWTVLNEPWPFEHVTVFQARAAQHQSLTAGLRVAAAAP